MLKLVKFTSFMNLVYQVHSYLSVGTHNLSWINMSPLHMLLHTTDNVATCVSKMSDRLDRGM